MKFVFVHGYADRRGDVRDMVAGMLGTKDVHIEVCDQESGYVISMVADDPGIHLLAGDLLGALYDMDGDLLIPDLGGVQFVGTQPSPIAVTLDGTTHYF